MDAKVISICFWTDLGLGLFGDPKLSKCFPFYAIGDSVRVYSSLACRNIQKQKHTVMFSCFFLNVRVGENLDIVTEHLEKDPALPTREQFTG